ncbi:NAD(P)H-dependent oxidoreductase [Snuella sedimenti]|uniref:NAD(P)H-dependent oxidoreductase n=1 Tax=Snuella sedimenti TaxID=2798802 RepID=A0A8J7J172_9FLAO|nr:NAD(P)H-dependent oxidoreductase [Snuella sedimenti]MBJ6367034.1 NAD(P)H-dependent oxidoreductase [Snuella sedimenti]
MEFIKHHNWRYATKKFEPSKKVSPENIATIKTAVQLSVSSYGLQLYKVLIIEDKKIREQLLPASWHQKQITEASHLFVFCNYTNVNPKQVDQYIDLTAKTRNLQLDALSGYGDFMKTKIKEKSADELFNWMKNQTYIALANLLSICAELKIDTCPMEGFEADKYNEILGLNKKGLNASVVTAIGYRDKEDHTQYLAKVRKPLDYLFETL